MRCLALLPLLALPVLVFAAPVPKDAEKVKMKRLFGDVADAKTGYDFALDGDKLMVTMAADASLSLEEKAPPRVEREVKGDFEMTVVLDFAPPKVKLDDAGKYPFLLAGFCLTDKDGRVEIHGKSYGGTGGKSDANGWGSGLSRWMLVPGEKEFGHFHGPDEEFYLYKRHHFLVRRKGDRFNFGESEDGKDWQIGGDVERDLPNPLRLGLIARNTTNAECTATFSDFAVTPLPKK